jgi:alkyl hydroperoxide reductase subunit D
VASALASRNAEVTRAVVAEFGAQLSPEALAAAKAAASIMGMNNVYYRFVHLVGGDYERLPARLRMNVIGKPGVEKVDFELWSLAVSAVNGCGMCLTSHEKVVREGGLSQEQVQTAVRIAAVVHAVAAILDGEDALSGL